MRQYLLRLMIFVTIVAPLLEGESLKTLVAPISQKGPVSSPYTITLNQNENLIIDIESPFSWHHCPRTFPRVSCHAAYCTQAQLKKSTYCQLEIPLSPPRPPCTCFSLPSEPFAKTCASSQFTYASVTVSSSDGQSPLTQINYRNIFLSCAPKSLLKSLPGDSSGIASLSKGSLSLIAQFANSKVPRKFGMCLGDQGVAFFGEGPFYLRQPPGQIVNHFLSFTPLLEHPTDTLGYYIDVQGITIDGEAVNIMKSVLSFDTLGNGGVKLSTVTPYTTLRSHVYQAFLGLFSIATSGWPRAHKVAPFDLCLSTKKLTFTRVGWVIPQINFTLSNGANWTIFGENSMVQVSNDVACLAFVDGGENAKQAILIGSFQMQHNFLLFDLEQSRLGFCSLPWLFQTSCNNFNFSSGV